VDGWSGVGGAKGANKGTGGRVEQTWRVSAKGQEGDSLKEDGKRKGMVDGRHPNKKLQAYTSQSTRGSSFLLTFSRGGVGGGYSSMEREAEARGLSSLLVSEGWGFAQHKGRSSKLQRAKVSHLIV